MTTVMMMKMLFKTMEPTQSYHENFPWINLIHLNAPWTESY